MKNKYYTNERNVQIVISLLKAHGIKKVVASPGTTNMTFVGSIQQDSWFEVYSSVDERSAAYLACGMAAESGEPVVISCTGATASRNYMPGLTEAYYRKLPVLAITSHRGTNNIGHLKDQQIDRRHYPNDIVNVSVTVPTVHDSEDEQYCVIEVSKAILALKRHGGGPAHINLFTTYSQDFSTKELPYTRVINRIERIDKMPQITIGERVAIFVGSHKVFDQKTTETIDQFCETYNALVICDKTSGYHGKYAINYSLIGAQILDRFNLAIFDKVIHIGEVSGDTYGRFFDVKEVWRISPDGEIRDFFGKLSCVFEMYEQEFFDAYLPKQYEVNTSLYEKFKLEYKRVYNTIPELPFGNIWIAQQMHDKLPSGCSIHLGIFNSLRSWDFFEIRKDISSSCNVGGFGIDGGISTLIGASLVNPQRLFFGVFGDLAFFYDMNVLGNRHVGSNVRILLINNGKGNEFRLSMHPCNIFGEDADKYMAAAGHFGNKSKNLVKHYSQDLGYIYLSACNKKEFLESLDLFVSPQMNDKPILFEVFTETEDERDALDMMLRISTTSSRAIKHKVGNIIRKTPLGKFL